MGAGVETEVNIELSWPPIQLSPNWRGHWAKKSSAVKRYRREACWVTKEFFNGEKFEDGVLNVSLVFYPPDKRARDEDNLIARMKGGLDGIADGLGINDRMFHFEEIEIRDKFPGGRVLVKIRQ